MKQSCGRTDQESHLNIFCVLLPLYNIWTLLHLSAISHSVYLRETPGEESFSQCGRDSCLLSYSSSDFPADSQDPLIIGRNPIIYSQFITDTPITHIWIQLMYFPDNIGNLFIPDLIVTFWMFQPSVIRRTSNSKVSAHLSDRISLWFGQFPDCLIFT